MNFFDNNRLLFCACLLVAAGFAVYANSFAGTFLFDDVPQIIDNVAIRSLAWPWRFMANTRRPFLALTFAVNYAFSQLRPWGYHPFNVVVHIASGIILMAVIVKTLRLPSMIAAFGKESLNLGLAAALLWLAHPLQTQAVTYITQRAESLMAMLFLLTVMLAANYMTTRDRRWAAAATLTSLLAGLTKEVAAALPVAIFLYDWAFVSGSGKEAWARHRQLYRGLALTWIVMLTLLLTTNSEQIPTAGFGYKEIPALQYFLNQPPVILHYIKLVFWPAALVFDYGWQPVEQSAVLLPAAALFLAGAGGSLLIWRRCKPAGFLAGSFFIILSPSSSFIPLKDLAVEHRMYLPSIFPILAALLIVRRLLWQVRLTPTAARNLAVASILILAGVLGSLTIRRNSDYHDEFGMWQDTMQKRPGSSRAQGNVGKFFLEKGRLDEALLHFQKAVSLDPRQPDIYLDIGYILLEKGDTAGALASFQKGIRLESRFPIAYNNIGVAFSQQGLYAQAVPFYELALKLGFRDPGVYENLGIAYTRTGNPGKAVECFREALRKLPDSAAALAELEAVEQRLK